MIHRLRGSILERMCQYNHHALRLASEEEMAMQRIHLPSALNLRQLHVAQARVARPLLLVLLRDLLPLLSILARRRDLLPQVRLRARILSVRVLRIRRASRSRVRRGVVAPVIGRLRQLLPSHRTRPK